jgi:hypothetical protein
MARVLVLVDDLLFGSRVQATLGALGHEVELLADEASLRRRLSEAPGAPGTVLAVDLVDQNLRGSDLIGELAREGLLSGASTLGFYAHVDAGARRRAQEAGFDLVVPRSRMAREGPQLIARLLSASGS